MSYRQPPYPQESIDVRELLKRGAFGSRSGVCDDHFEKSRACPSSVYGISDVYVVLDTNLAARRDPRRGEFYFAFGVGMQSGRDKIGIRESIRTLIQVDVEEFCTGIPPRIDVDEDSTGVLTLVANTATIDPRAADEIVGPSSQMAHCPRVTMLFDGLGAQSFSDFRSRHHHFEFSAIAEGDGVRASERMRLTPIVDRYVLTEPHQDLHELTVRFFSPDEPLNLPPGIITSVQLFALDRGGVFYLHIVGNELEDDHRTALDFTSLLASGDRIYLDNVNIDPGVVTNAGAINQFLSRPEGHIVGAPGTITAPGVPSVGGVTSNSRFELDPTIDMTSTSAIAAEQLLPLTAGSESVRLRIAKNRLRIPVRFRTIVDRLTNYIAP